MSARANGPAPLIFSAWVVRGSDGRTSRRRDSLPPVPTAVNFIRFGLSARIGDERPVLGFLTWSGHLPLEEFARRRLIARCVDTS